MSRYNNRVSGSLEGIEARLRSIFLGSLHLRVRFGRSVDIRIVHDIRKGKEFEREDAIPVLDETSNGNERRLHCVGTQY